MVFILVPLRLHIFFCVPVCLTFQMAAHQANIRLHDSHRIAVGISANGIKLPACKRWAIVKIHAFLLSTPDHRCGGSIRRANISLGALDILHASRGFE